MSEASTSPAPAAKAAQVASRRRLVLARSLTVLAILLTVVSVMANYVKREALDEDQFRERSRALIADPAVRNTLAAFLVDQLYANVDVSETVRARLPPELENLAGPISGAIRDLLDRSARGLLERPRVQDAFVGLTAGAQRQLVEVLDGETQLLAESDGNVVLDMRPLVLELGDRFGIVSDLEARIPEGSARITILDAERLKTAQDATKLLRFVANWIWVLALAAAAGAVWLARGRRRRELRANAIGLLVAGFLILVLQTMIGRYLVDELVAVDSVRPAVERVYSILTHLLRGDGWTAIIVAVVALVGLWLSGPRPRAMAARRALAPHLRRPEVAYGAVVVGYLLLLWWRPTPQFGFATTVLFFFVLALVGLEALRRQTAREFPDPEPVDVVGAIRAGLRRGRARGGADGASAELERLARLHAEGALDDAEFAAAKTQLLDRPLV